MFGLGELSSEDKYFVWGRKIDEQVWWYKDRGFSNETIRKFLQKCADWRDAWLEPDNLTEIEEIWTEKIQKHFKEFGVIDPIYENL